MYISWLEEINLRARKIYLTDIPLKKKS